MPNFLVAAGDPIRFRTFVFRVGDVVDLPSGLRETFSAAIQARLSSTADPATTTVPALYAPPSDGSESASAADWTADSDDLSTLTPFGDIDPALAFANTATSPQGHISGELAANGRHGWLLPLEVGAGETFEVTTRLLLAWPGENMSDSSRGMLAGLVFLDYDNDLTLDLSADNFDGVGVRQSGSVTSFQYGNPNGADVNALSAFHDGASPYQGPFVAYDLHLRREPTGEVVGYAVAGDTVTRITTPTAAGNGAGRVAVIAQKTNADPGGWVTVEAVRTSGLSLSGPHLSYAT